MSLDLFLGSIFTFLPFSALAGAVACLFFCSPWGTWRLRGSVECGEFSPIVNLQIPLLYSECPHSLINDLYILNCSKGSPIPKGMDSLVLHYILHCSRNAWLKAPRGPWLEGGKIGKIVWQALLTESPPPLLSCLLILLPFTQSERWGEETPE